MGLLKNGFGDCIFLCSTHAHMQYAIPKASFEKWLLRPTLICELVAATRRRRGSIGGQTCKANMQGKHARHSSCSHLSTARKHRGAHDSRGDPRSAWYLVVSVRSHFRSVPLVFSSMCVSLSSAQPAWMRAQHNLHGRGDIIKGEGGVLTPQGTASGRAHA